MTDEGKGDVADEGGVIDEGARNVDVPALAAVFAHEGSGSGLRVPEGGCHADEGGGDADEWGRDADAEALGRL